MLRRPQLSRRSAERVGYNRGSTAVRLALDNRGVISLGSYDPI